MSDIFKLDDKGLECILPQVRKLNSQVNDSSVLIKKSIAQLDMQIVARAEIESEIDQISSSLMTQREKMDGIYNVINHAMADAETTTSWLQNVIGNIRYASVAVVGGLASIMFRLGRGVSTTAADNTNLSGGNVNTVTVNSNNYNSYRVWQKNYTNTGIEYKDGITKGDYSGYTIIKGFSNDGIESQKNYSQFVKDGKNVGCGVTSVANAYNILNPDSKITPKDVAIKKGSTASVVWSENGMVNLGGNATLQDLANNIHNNNPVVVLMKYGKNPHYVTVVGLKEGCNISNPQLSDFLVIDPGGTSTAASIKTMDEVKQYNYSFKLMTDQMWVFK